MLIKGDLIQKDLKRAKNYLSKELYRNNSNVYFLYGKILYKEKKFIEARNYFRQSAEIDNFDGMFEYGKMLFSGVGGEKNIDEALRYLKFSKNNGNKKSELYILALEKMNSNDYFVNLPSEIQNYFISLTVKFNLDKYYSDENKSKNLIIDHEIKIKYKYLLKFVNEQYFESTDFISFLRIFKSVAVEIIFLFRFF